MTGSITEKIRHRIKILPKGSIVTARDFYNLASEGTVRQIISRLQKEGRLIPLGHGLYKKKNYSDLFEQEVPANPYDIATAYAKKMGWSIFPAKDWALNLLGLSTQVSNAITYGSSGPTTTLRFENFDIDFNHVPVQNLTGEAKFDMVINTLNYLDKSKVEKRDLVLLNKNLSDKEFVRFIKKSEKVSERLHANLREMEALR